MTCTMSEFKGMEDACGIGQALADATDLLLLDEPTNHLDIESIEFEVFLLHPGAILLISHDRVFGHPHKAHSGDWWGQIVRLQRPIFGVPGLRKNECVRSKPPRTSRNTSKTQKS